ncbi:MAG: FAD-dependent monooxygenase [Acetobacteraceae bacterium]
MLHPRGNGEAASAPTVLIVGAGPAGLFAACELLCHGVKPRVVERRPAPHGETRGTALQPAVLEIIDRGGLIEPFLRAGVRIRHIQLLGPGLREIAVANFADIGCKCEFQCSLPQWRTEAILRQHLTSLGPEVEFGTDVTSIEDDPAGLRVTLETGGRTEAVAAAYVLGAGGGHSVTRHSMREHLAGETYGGRYAVADVKLRLPCPPECGRVTVGPAGFGMFSPLPDGRWLIFVNRDEADTLSERPTEAELGALLNARTGVDVGLSDLRWASYFRMHKRAVESLSDGRRFLLGDAAHLSSPLGGEGVNAALMDAADIAWKLALVVGGGAKPSLLDSYATERGLADRHVLEVSQEIHGRVMELVAMCGDGGVPTLPQGDKARNVAAARRRSMLDGARRTAISRRSKRPHPSRKGAPTSPAKGGRGDFAKCDRAVRGLFLISGAKQSRRTRCGWTRIASPSARYDHRGFNLTQTHSNFSPRQAGRPHGAAAASPAFPRPGRWPR